MFVGIGVLVFVKVGLGVVGTGVITTCVGVFVFVDTGVKVLDGVHEGVGV